MKPFESVIDISSRISGSTQCNYQSSISTSGNQVGKVWTGEGVAAIYLDYPVAGSSQLRVYWQDGNTLTINGPGGQSTTTTLDTKTGGTTLASTRFRRLEFSTTQMPPVPNVETRY